MLYAILFNIINYLRLCVLNLTFIRRTILTKKKKVSMKFLAFFIIYQILFVLLTAPFLVLYGPFSNIKKLAVGTIMGTRHQYLVTTFLSMDAINKITNKTAVTKENFESDAMDNIAGINIDSNISKEIIRYDLHPDSGRYDGYLLEVNPLKIRVAITKNLGMEGQKTSEMAKDHKALAAINGGSFVDSKSNSTFGGSGASPGGFVISNGIVVFKDCGEDVKQSVTAFTKEGQLIVGEYSINQLKKYNVSEALCFRPPTLIINGKGQIKDAGSDGLQPRTAIGQTKNGTVLLLVMDGRKNLIKSGASLKDVQDELLSHGAINATSLDGGFSSTMYYDGKVINSPHGWNGERYVATTLYVAP